MTGGGTATGSDAAIKRFVTLAVSRDDVFRPAVDPRPATRWACRKPRARSCGRVFPPGVPVERPGADRYGASEYVLRDGATVRVTAITPYRRYCR